MDSDSRPRWQRAGKKPAIVLIGMSGVGKSYWSEKYGERIHLTDLFLNQFKSSGAFTYISIDDEIAGYLVERKWLEVEGSKQEPVELLAEFVGKFGSEQLGGLARADFLARQETYRDAELAIMASMPNLFKSAYDGEKSPFYTPNQSPLPESILYDTTGSFCEVINITAPIYERIKDYAIIIYLACNEHEEKILLQRQLENPKPMVYNKELFESCLQQFLAKHGGNESSVKPDDFLRFIFPEATKYRRKLYENLAQVVITTADFEKMYQRTRPISDDADVFIDRFAESFLKFAREKYEEAKI